MNAELINAFRAISNHCRRHYRVGANCQGCEITEWCEDRGGFPKEWIRYIATNARENKEIPK